MTIRSLYLISACALTALVSLACSNDEDSPVLSQQGESCESSADCADGLACFGGKCIPPDIDVTPNQKECLAIQCDAPADCCTYVWNRDPSCSSYESLCESDPTNTTYCNLANGPECNCAAADYACEEHYCRAIQCQAPADCCDNWTRPSICDSYESLCTTDPTLYAYECTYVADNCTCTAANYSCRENICIAMVTCTADTDCSSDHCAGGQCVECADAGDCSDPDATCDGGWCITPECISTEQCPAFEACQDGECVPVGCATDRECMIAEDSPLASCNKDADPPECEVACITDAECAQPGGHPLRVCVDGLCQDPGCESDDECKLVIGGSLGLLGNFRAVCRSKE